MDTETITPSITTVGTPTEVLVSILLTIDQAAMLQDILDGVRDDDRTHAAFADDLYITLNRSEEWDA